jgi:hypothetical protein
MAAETALELLDQPVPIYMIGESHCMAFKDRLFRETTHFNKTFLAKGLFIPTISTHNFMEDGDINAELRKALMSEMLLTGDGRGWTKATIRPTHVRTSDAVRRPHLVPADPIGLPILVFFVGEIALRAAFLATLEKRDFDLPFEAPFLDDIPSNDDWDKECEHVPFEVVLKLFNQVAGPLLNGLVALYDMGFTRLYLHSVPPPTLNDAEFEWMNKFYTPARLRYKAALLFNTCFATFCNQYHIGFLDIWNEVTLRNALRPEFYLDGCHLNPTSVPITLDKLMTRLAADPRPAVVQRYEYALEEARSVASETVIQTKRGFREQWVSRGLLVDCASKRAARRLRSALEYQEDAANRHIRLDWNGGGLEPGPVHLRAATPSRQMLEDVYALLYSDPLLTLLQNCNGADFAAASARFFRYEPHAGEGAACESFHRDDFPPGVIRCCMYLTDVEGESTAFEYLDFAGQPQRITGLAGTVIIFDGARLEHRWASSPSRGLEVLDLALIPRHKTLPRCVIWSGMNNWPVDPFNFSMDGFVAYPDDFGTEQLSVALDSEELMDLRLQPTVA